MISQRGKVLISFLANSSSATIQRRGVPTARPARDVSEVFFRSEETKTAAGRPTNKAECTYKSIRSHISTPYENWPQSSTRSSRASFINCARWEGRQIADDSSTCVGGNANKSHRVLGGRGLLPQFESGDSSSAMKLGSLRQW